MVPPCIRFAARAVVLAEGRLLPVNAYPGDRSVLWCAAVGGVEGGRSLPNNLVREIREETGLIVAVGDPILANEFHDPEGTFHHVDIYFRCSILAGALNPAWQDPDGVVSRCRFFAREEMSTIRNCSGRPSTFFLTIRNGTRTHMGIMKNRMVEFVKMPEFNADTVFSERKLT